MQQTSVLGLMYVFGAFIAWGFLPLYWKLLQDVSAGEILANRIIWSFIFVIILLISKGRLKSVKKAVPSTKQLLLIVFCSLLIGANWFIYIWAVNANHLVEASLGYYINPLLVVLLGIVILHERLNVFQGVAVVIAAAGVSVVTLEFGQIPWIAISLASTFAIYGLFKKMIPVDPTAGLAIETAVLVPLAIIYLGYLYVHGDLSQNFFTARNLILLMGTGIVTALPLLWFAKGTQLVALSTVGFTQYLAPSISLFIGVIIFGEPFSKAHLLSFSMIWFALVIYSMAKTRFAIRFQATLGAKTSN